MADGVCPFLFGDLNNALCNDGTRKRRTEQIFVFVHRARLHRGIDVILDEFFAQVFYVQFGRARFQRLFFQPVQLALLPYVGRDRDHFAVVIVFFQPRNNDGGIQSARIGKDNFLNLFLFHMSTTSFFYCLRLYRQAPRKVKRFALSFSEIFNFKHGILYKMYIYALLNDYSCIIDKIFKKDNFWRGRLA